jgi:hypothetical protein
VEIDMKKKQNKNNNKKHIPRRSTASIIPAKAPSTQRGATIYALMSERKIKGNYKDYVLILDHVLMDWLGEYNMAISMDGEEIKRVTINGMALVHKNRLAAVLGEEVGKAFWQCGMRTNLGVESRRTRCVRASK